MSKRLAWLLALVGSVAVAQPPVIRIPPRMPVASFPICNAANKGAVVAATDGNAVDDCTIGTGFHVVLCLCLEDSTWTAVGTGVGASMVYPGAGVAKSTGTAWDTSYTVGTGANNLVQLNGSSQLPAVSAALLTNFPTLNQSTTGNAATASALAANGSNCSSNQAALGVDASGAAEGCWTPAQMVYPGAGVANSSGSAWSTSYTVGTAANNLVQLDNSGALPAVSAANLTTWPTFNQSTTGNAATATALAANGGNCSAGQAALGVDASGAAEGCWTVPTAYLSSSTNYAGSASQGGAATTAAASDHSITACGAGQYVSGLSTAWALTCGTPTATLTTPTDLGTASFTFTTSGASNASIILDPVGTGTVQAPGQGAQAVNHVQVGLGSSATGTNATYGDVALGHNALANGGSQYGAVAIGAGAQAKYSTNGNNSSVAVGTNAAATGATEAIAIGVSSTASGTDSIAIGGSSAATADYVTAIGAGANSSHVGGTSVGRGSTSPGDYSMALGYQATIGSGNTGSLAIGTNATTTASNQAVLGAATFPFVDLKQFISANGAAVDVVGNSESITLSTSGTTTDSSANLLPANAIIQAVACRVTTTITTATDWSVGDGSTAARFCAANSTLTSGTTTVCLDQHKTAGNQVQASAAKLRITTTGTPGAGAIRCTVFATTFTAPTS